MDDRLIVALDVPNALAGLDLAERLGITEQFVADPNFLLVTDQLSNTYDQNTVYVTNGTALHVSKNRGVSWSPARTPTFTETNYVVTFGGGMDNADVAQITATGTGPFPFATTTTNGSQMVT